jgi:hypothetical protein
MQKLSKFEWQEKIKKYHEDVLGKKIDKSDTNNWWYNGSDHSGLRLTPLGLGSFKEAQIELNKYDCCIERQTGSIILGLSRMQSPFFYSVNGLNAEVYLCEPEYEMLLIFMDKNLELFAKGFLK